MVNRLDKKVGELNALHMDYCENHDNNIPFSDFVREQYKKNPNFLNWLYDTKFGGNIPNNEEIEEDIEEIIHY